LLIGRAWSGAEAEAELERNWFRVFVRSARIPPEHKRLESPLRRSLLFTRVSAHPRGDFLGSTFRTNTCFFFFQYSSHSSVDGSGTGRGETAGSTRSARTARCVRPSSITLRRYPSLGGLMLPCLFPLPALCFPAYCCDAEAFRSDLSS
jgi:hypothetical protein